MSDATVQAVGKLSEALEWVERARGRLYDFHQLSGRADLLLGEAVELLRNAGHETWADELDRELVGRNVLPDRWTFEIVEEYDRGYWATFRSATETVEADLVAGRSHLFEAEMKARRQT